MEDALLVEQFKQGNLKSYEVLYKKYHKVLVLYAKQFVNDLQIAENIVQDTFVTLYEKRDALQIHTSFKSFMYTVVRNNCLNYLKRESKILVNSDISNELPTHEESEHTITKLEMAEKLHRAINQLPQQNQQIFKLSKYRGLTNEEISEKLGLTKRTVETHISNALKKLRATLTMMVIILINFITLIYVLFISNLSYL
ncbi:RNA polymerase sigma-70 factor [Aquimarina sp. ERC-38]|uniref:RNA polymerase sigma-70 factor n=1 Tax=Aquimarina sp. ERC-38 TaxID=2949996 RepID=UPI00224774E5|nr:RNA polymerase sigma-70 factor [Aquimarina sp. ERC-38]UZO80144.1 RNA polymerase sigma-70 factor [Aquimarina sp. ERC-38]